MSFESTGPAGDSLGLPLYFTVINQQINGFNVYISSNGTYLFVNEAKNWVVGHKMGDNSSIFFINLQAPTTTVPSCDWKYREERTTSGAWIDDTELMAKPLKGKCSYYSL